MNIGPVAACPSLALLPGGSHTAGEIRKGTFMRPILTAALCALSLSVAPAFAEEPMAKPSSGTPDAEHIPTNDGGSQVACINRIHEGMVTSTVDCKTKSTWDRIRRENQRMISEMQLRSLTSQQH